MLKVRLRAGEIEFSVEDFAGGLSADEAAHAFEKFHRAKAEGGAGGVGLGLAICRAIVELHGGHVRAECVSGGATAFRFTLPLDDVPAMPAEPSGAADG
jgi:two-component system sensor histidine kinase KdpD